MATGNRAVLAAVGAISGLGLWALTDILGDSVGQNRWAFAAMVFAFVGAGSLLALTGPLRLSRAALGAVGLAAVLTVLESVAALRHGSPEKFIGLGYGIGLAIIMTILALPFVLAWLRGDGFPAPYKVLFDETLTGVVRVGLAFLAAGAIWLLFLLSSELLQIVGIDLLVQLRQQDWFSAGFTGALVGLALAVVIELLETRPPVILLRLLRLLVPFVLAVVVVFLIALPINGFGRTFGGLSAAGTLMGMASVVLLLVSLVIGTGTEEPPHRVIRACAVALSAVLPVIAACAVAAVWLRVGQYGWTPSRLMGMSFGIALLAFGVMSAAALFQRARWDEAYRRGNRMGLMLSLVLSTVWLLPILRPEAITVRSQEARAMAATAPDAQLYWDFDNKWGYAGQAALARIRAAKLAAGDTGAVAMIDLAVGAEYRWDLNQASRDADTENLLASPDLTIPSWPIGLDSKAILTTMSDYFIREFLASCGNLLPSGAPACVHVQVDLRPDLPGPENLFFTISEGELQARMALEQGQEEYLNFTDTTPETGEMPDPAAAIDALQRGQGIGAELVRPAIQIGDLLYFAL